MFLLLSPFMIPILIVLGIIVTIIIVLVSVLIWRKTMQGKEQELKDSAKLANQKACLDKGGLFIWDTQECKIEKSNSDTVAPPSAFTPYQFTRNKYHNLFYRLK